MDRQPDKVRGREGRGEERERQRLRDGQTARQSEGKRGTRGGEGETETERWIDSQTK